jgi:molecular chaperone DnaK
LKEVSGGDAAEAIAAKSQVLAEASMKLGEAIYKAQAEEEAAEQQGDQPTGAAEEDSDVVDAEFEEVDDGKKS